MIDAFLASTVSALHPQLLPFLVIGVVLGIIIGGIPGLTALMLISLSLPLTFYMDDSSAIAMLVGMYVGGISGGLVTAVVLGIPGTPSSILTTFDGHGMARQGQAGKALSWAILASVVGSFVSWVALATLSVPLARLALRFGPFDLFGLCLLALVTIVAVSRGAVILGLISGAFGILLSMVGTDPIGGGYRFTFGYLDLASGFDILPVLIGLFAGSAVIGWAFGLDEDNAAPAMEGVRLGLPLRDIAKRWWSLLRSSVLGTAIGILPGIGGNIGSFIAYSAARAQTREPETFGESNVDGIIASEAGNNATVGGALIPLIALGIPGSVIDVVLIGALTLHNIQPGPYLFRNNPEIVYVMISAMLIATLVTGIILWWGAGLIARIARVNRTVLFPMIAVFSLIGSFAFANRWFDVWIMIAFSIVGLIMARGKIPVGPFVIGLVLGPVVEEYYRIGLMATGGEHLPMLTSPVSAVSIVACITLLLWPIVQHAQKRTHVE